MWWFTREVSNRKVDLSTCTISNGGHLDCRRIRSLLSARAIKQTGSWRKALE